MKKTLLTISAIAVSSVYLFAQSQLPEKYPNESKVKVLYDFPKEGRNTKGGKGFSANVGILPNGIKKVGLVSFYVFDPGVTKTWTTTTEDAVYVTTTTHYKKRSTGGLSSDIAVGVFAKAIEPLTKKFKEGGIDLLLPDQFLDTEEKKQFYNSFQVENEGFAKWLKNMGSGNHDVMYGIPEGFNLVNITAEPYANYSMSGMLAIRQDKVSDNQIYLFAKDTKLTESIGYDLCTKLGLDAVIVTYMTVFAKSDSKIQLQNVRMVMFGPNPVMPEGESKHGMIPHVKGLFYVGTSVNPEEIMFNSKKKEPATQKFDFTSFDLIYTAMASKMLEYITESKE